MKKYLIMMLFCALSVLLPSIRKTTPHTHLYQSEVTVKGDCCNEGVRTYTCLECGYSYTEHFIGEHQYIDSVVPSTYDNCGYSLYHCAVCGESGQRNITRKKEKSNDDIQFATITGIHDKYAYNGRKIIPSISIQDLKGKALEENQDYQIRITDNVDIGTATVTIEGIGNYTNTCTKTFEIVHAYWDTVDGNRYFYLGEPVTGFQHIYGKGYFFNDDGIMQTGWQEIEGNYYCFNRFTGEMVVNQMIDGIQVDENGIAVLNDYNFRKIQTMMTAHQIMLDVTLPTDPIDVKRLKVFKWEMYQHGYHQWRKLSNIYQTSTEWELTFANDIFQYGSGCCVSDACAVAFLIREVGYSNIYVCHDSAHAWVTVDGALYDPLFAESISFQKNYNAGYTDYRQWPLDRIRIDGERNDV